MKKHIRTFQQEGFSLRVEAMTLLKKVLERQPQEEMRADLVQALLDDLKVHARSGATHCVVTQEQLQQAVQNLLQKQTEPEEGRALVIENAFEFPRIEFQSSRNTYERVAAPKKHTLHGTPQDKIQFMRQRLEAVQRRLLRDPLFQSNEGFTSQHAQETIRLTSVEELVDSQGSHSVVGFLSRMEDEALYLEDLSGYVKLQFKGPSSDEPTQIIPALYSEGAVVLVQGSMRGGVFEVTLVGPPRVEARETFLQQFPSFEQLAYQGDVPSSATMVLASELHLDNPLILQKLRTLFDGYSANQFMPELFVFVGNFHSVPLDSLGTNSNAYQRGWDALVEILESFPLIKEHATILFVPGPNDPFASGVLPRKEISPHFTKNIRKLDYVQFTSNPCRLQFYGQEMVFYRDDLLGKIQRLALPIIEQNTEPIVQVDELHEHYAQFILSQAHLSPLPIQVNPVYWNLDYTLQFDVLPHMVCVMSSLPLIRS